MRFTGATESGEQDAAAAAATTTNGEQERRERLEQRVRLAPLLAELRLEWGAPVVVHGQGWAARRWRAGTCVD